MKRMLCIILALIMCLSLLSCGEKPVQDETTPPVQDVTDDPVTDTQTETKEEEEPPVDPKTIWNGTLTHGGEGFYDPDIYPIFVTPHAERRFAERLGITDPRKMRLMAIDAYRFGKSKRQIMKSSAYLVEEMEQKHSNSVVLIYRNVIYIFSVENVLITLYKNDKITL